MAAVVLRNTTTSTSNTSSYASASFTPTAGDLLVVLVCVTGSVATDATLTASANGITFTDSGQHPFGNATANTHYVFVANQLVGASPSAMTVTFSCTSDAGTGCDLVALAATGMSKTGAAAILQAAGESDRVASQTPTIVFAGNITAGNPVIGGASNNANPAAIAEPSGWTEQADTGHATPTTGFEVASIDSHAGGTATVAWGAASASRGGGVAVELDGSASGPSPQTVNPSGIAAAGSVGAPTVTTGAVTVTPTGVASAQAVGSPTVSLTPPAQTVSAAGVASAGAVGSPAVTPGPVSVTPTGIATAGGVGTPTVTAVGGIQTVNPTGIGSGQAIGTPTVGTTPVTISPEGITAQGAVGVPTVRVRPWILRLTAPTDGARTTVKARGASRALFSRVVSGGVPPAVLVTGGVVTEVAKPTVAEVNAADYAFMGGMENEVPAELIDALTAAGYELIPG